MRVLAVLGWMVLVAGSPVGAATLATPFGGGFSNSGIMFDVVADKPLTISALQFSTDGLEGGTVEVYTRSGTHVGSEGTPGDWTLVASAAFAAGPNNAPKAPVALDVPILVGGGARQAFYLRSTVDPPRVSYSVGDGVGTVEATDGNLSIFEGTGVAGSFETTFANRIPNVVVHYDLVPSAVTTTFVGANFNDGIMFDVVAASALTIDALQFAFNTTGTSPVRIYTRPGTHVGFESDPTAWTLVALANSTAAVAQVAMEPVSLNLPVPIAAGGRQAFFIVSTGTTAVSYTTGTATGTLRGSDANLSIFEGRGMAGVFLIGQADRIPNVTAYYTLAVPESEVAVDAEAPAVAIAGRKRFRATTPRATIFGVATDDVGVDSVRVSYLVRKANGAKRRVTKAVVPAGNGLFRIAVPLAPGRNRVTFQAIDGAGKSSKVETVVVTR